ncbi:ArsR/SmtB family transcription factor [Parvularcula dongshanensis]|uniref:Ubiquinone/menaquinone biosynthesis C-methylase UbiE n=1 Tax=Parvularcula dongshanensis TaxID=1173995 RepID=A0A840I4C0_9PROT|nr:metalloregulator ArsR/SmtB family transcription factor [Parvularcula dongshanensis]MBB4659018.1 ubiquinone/menaquinone biosynthesis C-methylase UbiE [Parvularcula dongshanensis]
MSRFDVRLAELRAAGEPTRLRLLALLAHAELTVTELTTILGQSQPGVSRHLRLLCEAGLAERHQEGAWAFYRARLDEAFSALLADLRGPELDADFAALDAVREERAAAAARYFAEHAAEWDGLRRLYLPEGEIEAAMLEMVPGEGRLLVDLGTGTGRMLTLFGAHYDQSIGFDASPEMLALARVKVEAAGLRAVRLRRADLFELPETARGADLVVLHHVLHYLAEPERAVSVAGRLLAQGGQLLIADFAPHANEALRDTYAHRRLGFADAEVGRFAQNARLRLVETRTFPSPGPDGLTAKLWRLERAAAPPSKESLHVGA